MSAAADYSGAVLLGVVEGVTEFLPISSTGHLIVASHLLGRTEEGDKLFEVVIQLGAILAVLWEYRARFLGYLRAPAAAATRHFVANIALAFLPAAVVGFFAHGFIKAHLFSPAVVAAALIIGGAVILAVEKNPRQPRVVNLENVSPRTAFYIGCAQCLAMIPGVSRAGATIIGAMLLGLRRKTAAEFSFMLAIPTMFAAAGWDLLQSRDLLNADLLGQIAAGFVSSFICALVAIRALLAFLSTHNFAPFGWYRIAFGGAVALMLWAGWM